MVRIAVTGGIACGKSLVGSYLAEQGIAVCEADRLAHGALSRGEPVFDSVVRAFGNDILGADGAIDRSVLGKRVFADPALLARLNALVHPEVKRRWLTWMSDAAGDSRPAAAIIPLLYEIGEEREEWTAVICVSAPRSRQLEWLALRGLTPEEAEQRIASQWPSRRKMALADYVIINSGTKELLIRQTQKALRCILET
jgi:dephospho-CoA kinase